MNKLQTNEDVESELSAALDHTVEAAVALKMSETELTSRLVEEVHSRLASRIPLLPDLRRKIYDPSAGP